MVGENPRPILHRGAAPGGRPWTAPTRSRRAAGTLGRAAGVGAGGHATAQPSPVTFIAAGAYSINQSLGIGFSARSNDESMDAISTGIWLLLAGFTKS